MITTSGKHTQKNPHKAAYAHRAHKNLLKDTELFLFSIRFRNLATVKKREEEKALNGFQRAMLSKQRRGHYL